jgi:hypothetical protein
LLASAAFSVVWVTLTLRSSTSQTVSADNAALITYQRIEGTSSLGAFASFPNLGCYTGAEMVGTVQPSNYTGLIVLRRTLLSWASWNGSTNTKMVTTPADDTSNARLRDDDPQSGSSSGRSYDLDAPGVSPAVAGAIYHTRQNFSGYAVLDNETNTVPVSSPLAWYSAVSCTLTSNNFQLSTGIAGDNVAGPGSVKLSWNLQ